MPAPEKSPGLLITLLGLLASGLLFHTAAFGDALEISVSGIPESQLSGIQSRLNVHAVSSRQKLGNARLEKARKAAELDAVKAMRPLGYYHAEVKSDLQERKEGDWLLKLTINPGPPLLVSTADIQVSGAGAGLEELKYWQRNWPMKPGKRLNQVKWEEQKSKALEVAESHGFLAAQFIRQQIRANIDLNTAELELELATGPRAVMGEVRFEQDVVKPSILGGLARFEPGQVYDAWLLEKLRHDVWQTGYFEDVEVIEERRLEESPPVVNLLVKASARKPNTWQGTLGYGTDTGIRAQALWTRRLLSSRGDSLEVGLGWQETNNEYSFRSGYRLPRRHTARQFWTADFAIRRANQDLEIRIDPSNDYITLASGDVTSYSLKSGLLVLRDFESGYQQIYENWYGQYVRENNDYALLSQFTPAVLGSPAAENLDLLEGTGSSIVLGVNWDWPAVRGSGFETVGHHQRLWLFTANEAWGSDSDFSQAYVSSNWHRLMGDRFKLLLRGEVGYSDADVREFELQLNGQSAGLSVSRLPSIFRFKAGGSRSVRGYAFESLSNNGIGSNHIVTASAEVEMLLYPKWAAAAFADTGNAFNKWDDLELQTGVGLGLRWYTVIGSLSLDIAHPLDLDDDPWRVHFTIGTPLL